jgi:hypothetical protein
MQFRTPIWRIGAEVAKILTRIGCRAGRSSDQTFGEGCGSRERRGCSMDAVLVLKRAVRL